MSASIPQSEPQLDPIVVTYPQLKSLGPDFSNCQLIRLEKSGRFPRRFYLSAKKPCWYRADIIRWIGERAAASYRPTLACNEGPKPQRKKKART
jgi:predicted DNA-binding transcriptional regulator AlpA